MKNPRQPVKATEGKASENVSGKNQLPAIGLQKMRVSILKWVALSEAAFRHDTTKWKAPQTRTRQPNQAARTCVSVSLSGWQS